MSATACSTAVAHDGHPRGGRARAVVLAVVHEQALLGTQTIAQAPHAQLVDLRVGLAHSDERAVDDDFEDGVDRRLARQCCSHSRTLFVSSAIR